MKAGLFWLGLMMASGAFLTDECSSLAEGYQAKIQRAL